MKAKAILLLSLCVVLAGCGRHSQSGAASMKPGLWETKIVKMEMDGKDMLAQMPSMAPLRTCISPEMAERVGSFVPPRLPSVGGCSQPKLEREGNRTSFEMTCNDNSVTGETVIDGDQINSKAEVTMTIGGARHTTLQESQMTFVGSDCGNITPQR